MKEMTHQNSRREGPLLPKSRGGNPKIILPQLLWSDSRLLQRVKEQEAEFSGVRMAEEMTVCKEKHQDRSDPLLQVSHGRPTLLQQWCEENNTEFSCSTQVSGWIMDTSGDCQLLQLRRPHPTRVVVTSLFIRPGKLSIPVLLVCDSRSSLQLQF